MKNKKYITLLVVVILLTSFSVLGFALNESYQHDNENLNQVSCCPSASNSDDDISNSYDDLIAVENGYITQSFTSQCAGRCRRFVTAIGWCQFGCTPDCRRDMPVPHCPRWP